MVNAYRELLSLSPSPGGGYDFPPETRQFGPFTIWEGGHVSSDGYDEMLAQARVMESCRDTLDALAPFLGRCEHGLDVAQLIEDEEWHWSINDYVQFAHNHRDTELVIILGGFHAWDWGGPTGDYFKDVYCLPWAFNPAGVLYPW